MLLKRYALLLFMLLFTSGLCAQTMTDHLVAPVGVYKTIKLDNDIRVMLLLSDTNYVGKAALVDSVMRGANGFTPPVLYAMSYTLFHMDRRDAACFWFYTAQLRARYDVNRCADKTATAELYNENFGPPINQYAMRNLDTLERIVQRVVTFVRTNEERYDERWINLSGMDVMMASLGKADAKKSLSLPKAKWPAIKTKTVDDYYNDFEEYVMQAKKK